MPQNKSADNASTTSTDSSVFDVDNPKSKNTDACWSGLSGATSTSSMLSAISADGPPELVPRSATGASTSYGGCSAAQSTSTMQHSLIPSLRELTSSEQVNAAGLKQELQGFMNKVVQVEDQLHSLKKKLVNKQKYISTLEVNLKRIEENNTKLKTEVTQLNKDNETLRRQLYGSEEPAASNSPTRVRRELSPAPSEREMQLENHLDRVLQENSSLKQKIQGLEEQLSQTIQQLEQTRSRHEQRRQDIEMLLMQASKELETVEAERDETQRLLTQVLNKNAGASSKEEGLRTQFESLLMLQKPTMTSNDIVTLKDRLFAAHKQIDVLETDFSEEHEQRLSAERELARMKATVRDLERECDTLRLQVQFLQEDFYKEREDKQARERALKASNKEMHFYTQISSGEKGATGGDQSHVFMYQAVDPGGVHMMDVRTGCGHRRIVTSDLECDNTSTSTSSDRPSITKNVSPAIEEGKKSIPRPD